MAIFLSKRLIRFFVLVGLTLVGLLALGQHSSTRDYVKPYIPDSLNPASYISFNPKNLDNSDFEENRDADLLRQAEEGTLIAGGVNDDPEAIALKEAAEPEEDLRLNDGTPVSADSSPLSTGSHESSKDSLSVATGPGAAVQNAMAASFAHKGRPRAAFVTLARNSDLGELIETVKNYEAKFNHQFNYPWVFLNDDEFTEEFKTTITELVSGEIKFGRISHEQWSYPSYIDQDFAKKERERMRKDHPNLPYADSEPYRHMCRYQSGFFWRHPLLDDFDWYWRVEPSTKLHCDVPFDAFKYMQDNQKAYGFVITIHEYEVTIKTLWETSMGFFRKNPDYVAKDNLMKFISGDDGKTYNLCHFWSNFEIANLNLWRSQAYLDYFEHLDRRGGFFYERWGDAPVHSIAASLLLPKDQIHYFSDIGYFHMPYNNCPLDKNVFEKQKCECDVGNDFTFQSYACGKEYYESQGMTKPAGWEKYRD